VPGEAAAAIVLVRADDSRARAAMTDASARAADASAGSSMADASARSAITDASARSAIIDARARSAMADARARSPAMNDASAVVVAHPQVAVRDAAGRDALARCSAAIGDGDRDAYVAVAQSLGQLGAATALVQAIALAELRVPVAIGLHASAPELASAVRVEVAA
jgi:hypothetical protein